MHQRSTGPAESTAADAARRVSGASFPGLVQTWSALGGAEALLSRVARAPQQGLLPSTLPVQELASASVAACSLAAAELADVRDPAPEPSVVTVDDVAVAAAFGSERHLRIDGRAAATFAPLSRFWPTADGWVRTHANYPHHRTRLLTALSLARKAEEPPGTPQEEEALAARVGAELATREADAVEESVAAVGGFATAVRTPQAWAAHPQHAAAADRPLVRTARLDHAPVLPLGEHRRHQPLSGVRVLDLTRVIAGPVATRTLALLGADVLRLDSPHLPELPDTWADVGFGKRSAALDLANRGDQRTFEQLLDAAHVVVTGYRPGSLDRYGLAPESLAARRPGLVIGQVCAWGECGPWRRRGGFDSLVQAATGLAHRERHADGTPGALPVQALDHGTGYLLAAGVLRALTEQRTSSAGSRCVQLALTRTATLLTDELPQHAEEFTATHTKAPGTAWLPGPAPETLRHTSSRLGDLRYVRSPVDHHRQGEKTDDARPATDWSQPPSPLGTAPCTWR